MNKPRAGTLRADGRWAVTLRLYNVKTGVPRRVSLYGGTQEEVQNSVREISEKPPAGYLPATKWRVRLKLRPGTASSSQSRQYVYFIWTPDIKDPLVKVGISYNVKERLRGLQVGSPVRLAVLHQHRGGIRDESVLHALFGSEWSHGEWFMLSDDIRRFIETLKKHPGEDISQVCG